MQIHGFQKTTLLDFPGRVACTIFTGSCNFRCPFCQNSGLVLHPDEEPAIPEEDIISFLKKRSGILDGVCITGGEPTLQRDLPDFIKKIKALGYQVKLDTNGYLPDVLKNLCESGLIDYVAMDIKSSRETYSRASGIPDPDIRKIEDSASYLMNSGISYEFRTTVVRELHTASDFRNIGEWLAGCSAYYLQSYKDSELVMAKGLSAFSPDELRAFIEILRPWIPNVSLRGID